MGRRETAAWLALSHQMPARSAWSLVQSEGCPWEAWRRFGGESDPLALLRRMEAQGLRVVAPCDAEYPADARQLSEPPAVLYLRGKALPRGTSVAIVGSRQATDPGQRLAYILGWQMAEVSLPVVSGLARGIDTAAHRGCLSSPQGHPVAVIGCGFDYVYPRANAGLYREVAERGTLVTEYPPAAPPEPWRFPQRNRLVAALCKGLVVVEAGPKSGALITARMALELGREVMAVPGGVHVEVAQGTLGLLKDGAALIRTGADITAELKLPDPPSPVELALKDPVDRAIVRALGLLEGLTVDQLCERTGLPVGEVLRRLTRLQVEDVVQRLDTGRFVQAHAS